MTNLFKKSLVAVAVFAAGTVSAANLTVRQTGDLAATGPIGVSVQNTAQLDVSSATLLVSPGANYGNEYEITVEWSAGEQAVAPKAYRVLTADVAGFATASAAIADGDTVEITRVSQTAKTATFRIETATAVTAATHSILITGARLTSSSVLAAGQITAKVLVKSDTGVVTDVASGNDKLSRLALVAGDEFSGAITASNRLTSLAKLRKEFASGSKNLLVLTPEVYLQAGAYYMDGNNDAYAAFPTGSTVTATKTKFTVTGDFSWVVDSDAATAGVQPKAGTFAVGAECDLSTVKLAGSVLTYECNAADNTRDNTAVVGTNTVTFDYYQGGLTAPNAIPDGKYTLTAEQVYTVPGVSGDRGLVVIDNETAASINGNGQTLVVDYMPYGDKITQILYVTNKAAETGSIFVTAYDEAGKKVLDSVKVKTTVSRGITQISGEVADALKAAGFTGGKVALSIAVESSNATVFSAYNADGDRLMVK